MQDTVVSGGVVVLVVGRMSDTKFLIPAQSLTLLMIVDPESAQDVAGMERTCWHAFYGGK